MQKNKKDIVVIGGGIVGSAILHALSKFRLELALIEKQPDVCEGTSKANSGIIHTGFDAKPGTVEADCLRRAARLWPELIANLKIPYLQCGAVMVATSEEEKETILSHYVPNAVAGGVPVRWVQREELLAANPAVTIDTIGGLIVEGEGICDPFWATRAYAEIAVLNGAELILNNGVLDIRSAPGEEWLTIVLEDGTEVESRYIINAAGLWSDEISRMIGDESFSITPRKGQFLLTEDPVDISQIILPVPSRTTKGVLVSPVVFGGFLIGPTAEEIPDKWDRSTNDHGLESVLAGSSKLVPDVRRHSTIRQFAGVRAVCSTGDFIIRPSDANRKMIHAAGIRSTGVSASPGIAERVVEVLRAEGVTLEPKEEAVAVLPDLFEGKEEQGEIVCLCRSITRGEIEGALSRPIVPGTIDGVKRRTGAMLGECQGNGCIPKILDLMEERLDGFQQHSPCKGLKQSYVAYRGGEQA